MVVHAMKNLNDRFHFAYGIYSVVHKYTHRFVHGFVGRPLYNKAVLDEVALLTDKKYDRSIYWSSFLIIEHEICVRERKKNYNQYHLHIQT